MSNRTIQQIDNRIARLHAVMKRLRVERTLAILREQHRQIKFGHSVGAQGYTSADQIEATLAEEEDGHGGL